MKSNHHTIVIHYRRQLARCLSLALLLPSLAFAAPGSLDPAFGSGGKAMTDFASGDDSGNAVAIQADGKIVVAGYASNGSNNDFALTRYNSDGTLDATFGSGGKVTTNFASWGSGYAMAIQADGKIIVTGGSNGDFALARYNSDGTLDATFGSGGKVTTDFGSIDDFGNAVAIQVDGKIVVAGYTRNGGNLDFALARYDASGVLDATFGSGGKVTTAIGSGDDRGYSVAIQTDQKIVVAGSAFNGSNNDFALARYDTSGALDATFGSGGKVMTDLSPTGDGANSVAIQADGKVVVAGWADNGSNNDFALARYEANGALDGTFGSGGKVMTDFAADGDSGYSVAILADGKIVVAGDTWSSNYDFGLARYDSNGTLDGSFGSGGKVTTSFGSSHDGGLSVAIQTDGKIVVAGYTSNNSGNWDFAVARYLGDPVASVTPSSIPTLSEWGVILLTGLLGVLGIRVMRRDGAV